MRSSGRTVFSSGSAAISTYGYQTLFMPMSAAAVSAACACPGSSAPSRKAAISGADFAAKAAASAAPFACTGVKLERLSTASKLSRRSLA